MHKISTRVVCVNEASQVWNLSSDKEALKANSLFFFLSTIYWLDALKRREKIITESAFNKRK